MSYYIRAIHNGEYFNALIPNAYECHRTFSEALHTLTTIPLEHYGLWWDMLRIEDNNGRILARKERWGTVQLPERGRWVDYEPPQEDPS